jgi:Baseplate J-like protein
MNSTLQYLQTVLATNYPGLDVSAGSPLSELFLNPTAAMLDPVMTQLKYLLDNLGILNPENINPDELDTIAANFLVYRRQAIAAQGYVELFYNSPQNLIIPAGTIFTSSDDRQYSNQQTINITSAYMSTALWRYPLYSTGLIPVSAISDILGTMLEPGMITETTLIPQPTLVTNPNAFTAGVVTETNTEFATRLISTVMNQSLASEASFTNLITQNFPNVVNTNVISAGDSRMIRDIYYSGQEALQNYEVIDFYGKINTNDFYVASSGSSNTPDFDEYPFPQSKALWALFSGPNTNLLAPDQFVQEFTTEQYSNLYYLDDVLGTVLSSTIVLNDSLLGTAFNPMWLLGDVNFGTNKLATSLELQATTNGAQFGNTDMSNTAPVPVSREFLSQLINTLAVPNQGLVPIETLIAVEELLISATTTNTNYYPILHTPINVSNGISITGNFSTTDTSNNVPSYVTVLRQSNTIASSDGLGFAWTTGSGNLYNVYLVDSNPLINTTLLTDGYVFNTIGENSWLAAASGVINPNTTYSFALNITADYAMTLNIWPGTGAYSPSNTGLITLYHGNFTPQSNGSHFGISVAGTNGSTWLYKNIEINDIVNLQAVALFQMDATNIANGSTTTINCYGYGTDSVNNALQMYIYNPNTYVWNLLAKNTATSSSPKSQRLLTNVSVSGQAPSFTMSSNYKDINNYVNIAITTPTSQPGIPTTVAIDYIDMENTKPVGISIGGKSDIYINDPTDIIVGTQTSATNNGIIQLIPINGYALPLLNVASITIDISGQELQEGVDWELFTDNVGNAYSVRENPYISINPVYNNLDLDIIYRYNQVGISLQAMLDDPTKRFIGTDSLAKLAPPTIIGITTLSYSGTLSIDAAQTLIMNYINVNTTINVSDIISLLMANGVTYVDTANIIMNATTYDEQRNVISQTTFTSTYTCTYDLGFLYSDKFSLIGIVNQ